MSLYIGLNNRILVAMSLMLIYVSIISTIAIAKPMTENDFFNSAIKNMERDNNVLPEFVSPYKDNLDTNISASDINAVYLSGNYLKLWNVTEKYWPHIEVAYLDGDSLPDIIEYPVLDSTQFQYFLKARKGSNGQLLWQTSFGTNEHVLFTPVADLNGDGSSEILVSAYGSYYGKFYVKNGKTGQNLWTDWVAEKGAGHVVMWGVYTGDMNGDGKWDIGTIQAGYNATTGKYYYVFKARRGYDGKILWKAGISKEEEDLIREFRIDVLGDINKDKYSDIAITTFQDLSVIGGLTHRRDIAVYRGIDGKQMWFKSEAFDLNELCSEYSKPIGDLNGDNVLDILNIDCLQIYNPYRHLWKIRAYNGNNGITLWTRDITGSYDQYDIKVQDIFDVDGDYKNDLIFSYLNRSNYHVRAQKGNNGNTIWNVNYWSSNTGQLLLSTNKISDVNGDNIKDVIVELKSWFSFAGYTKTYLTTHIRSGKDGKYLWGDVLSGTTTPMVKAVYDMGDANGDKITDIIINKYKEGEGATYSIKKGNTGTTLWSGSGGKAMPAGDLNKDSRNDILLRYAPNLIDAKAGPSGTYLWNIKSTDTIYDPLYDMTYQYIFDFNGDGKKDVIFLIGKEIYVITTK